LVCSIRKCLRGAIRNREIAVCHRSRVAVSLQIRGKAADIPFITGLEGWSAPTPFVSMTTRLYSF
jgi:hypothetical protein